MLTCGHSLELRSDRLTEPSMFKPRREVKVEILLNRHKFHQPIKLQLTTTME